MIDKYLSEMSGVVITPDMIEKSVYNMGNTYPIAKVIQKALNGENVTICGFGGSITEGTGMSDNPPAESGIICSDNTKCYFDRFCDWWDERFNCKLNRVNAGIGATDTPLAIHRMGKDVLEYSPDFVILEWCCNDGPELLSKQATYEKMVRSFIEKGIPVILLSMATRTGVSSQKLHEPIAKFYDVPMISYRDAYIDYEKYPYFTTDTVHPNKAGCELASLLLCEFIEKVLNNIDNIPEKPLALPKEFLCEDASVYAEPYIVNLKDICDGKVYGIRIKDLGAFKIDEKMSKFAFRSYYGFSAYAKDGNAPMVIEIDDIKTLFLLLYRNTVYRNVGFYVEVNGEKIENETFTSQHGKDNAQTEWDYHWPSERICAYPDREKIELKIYPTVKSETQCIKIFSLLIS